MYELDCFETALSHFGTRVEIIVALEMGDKIDADAAYEMIKEELRQLKKIRKQYKNTNCDEC
jgi:DNA-directed RNA polymerase sigma subunit (sigma70/sigma32)